MSTIAGTWEEEEIIYQGFELVSIYIILELKPGKNLDSLRFLL